MEIVDQQKKDEVLNGISKHENIIEYYEIQELSFDEFFAKNGHWGIGQHNSFEIRFHPETNGLVQLKKLVSPDKQYFILPIDGSRKIFKDNILIVDRLFSDHRNAHLIVADPKFKWILIKTEFNKLIGFGDQIKAKMEKKVRVGTDVSRRAVNVYTRWFKTRKRLAIVWQSFHYPMINKINGHLTSQRKLRSLPMTPFKRSRI